MQTVEILNETQGSSVGERIECADSSWTRMFGLLGRHGLAEGGGLWITPSSGVHTMFMRFTIDVVGLDKHRRVVKLTPRLRPYRIGGLSLKVRSVVELAEGTIAQRKIQLGDVLSIL